MKLRTFFFSTTILILGAGCSSDSAATPSTDAVTTEVPSSDAPATDGARVVFGFTIEAGADLTGASLAYADLSGADL